MATQRLVTASPLSLAPSYSLANTPLTSSTPGDQSYAPTSVQPVGRRYSLAHALLLCVVTGGAEMIQARNGWNTVADL